MCMSDLAGRSCEFYNLLSTLHSCGIYSNVWVLMLGFPGHCSRNHLSSKTQGLSSNISESGSGLLPAFHWRHFPRHWPWQQPVAVLLITASVFARPSFGILRTQRISLWLLGSKEQSTLSSSLCCGDSKHSTIHTLDWPPDEATISLRSRLGAKVAPCSSGVIM